MISQILVNGYSVVQNTTSIPKYKRRKSSAIRDFPPGCGPNASQIDIRTKQEIDDIVFPKCPWSKDFEIGKSPNEGFQNSSALGPSLFNVPDSNISLGNSNQKFPQRRKISAVRDFPPLCGRDVPLLTKDECLKARSSMVSVLPHRDFGSEMEKFESEKKTVVPRLMVDEFDGDTKLQREMVVYNPEMGGAKICDVNTAGKEIVVHSEGAHTISIGQHLIVSKNPDKNVLAAACGSSRFASDQIDEYSRLECSAEHNDRNRQSKGTDLPSHSGFQNNRLKHGSSSGIKNSKGKKLFEERRVLKAGSNRKKASSNYVEATPLRSCNPSIKAIEEDELDSCNQDQGCDNIDVDHRTHEIGLLPVVPNIRRTPADSNDSASYKVRETLRLFQAVYRKLTHEDEATIRRGGNSRKRIDLDTQRILKEHGKDVNTRKIVGSVPGVDVGLEFQFRVELALVGLHRPPQAGIDFMKQDGTVIAISIVASGGYADDMDSADVLNYSGSGGNPSKGEKEFEDQKLERGNLALKHSIRVKNPVRVIRGHDHKISVGSSKTKTVKTYTYDGLYKVTRYWQEHGPKGNLVYMFRLERIPGQPELAWNLINISKKSKARHGVCVSDISEGKELMPICAVNNVDNQKPPSFKYIKKMLYPDWCQLRPLQGCDCVGGCSDSSSCLCAVRNGGEIPFNSNGSIVEVKPLIYECGPSCKCPPSCSNRVSQFGIQLQLEIFKTKSRGWGVRSLNYIPSGSFICEYLGELLDDKQAEQRIGSDEYLFDIGSNSGDQNLLDELPNSKPHPRIGSSKVVDDVGFTIDAERYGNVGRFINHSCSPNLYAQNLLFDHEDWRMPHIMLFAVDNIPPLQELTYHYNYTIGEVRDANGNVKIKRCFCGSADCSGRLY